MPTALKNAPVTVAICTRNRGPSLVPTLESIFSSDHPDFKVLVIDQSPNDDTQNAVAPFLNDPRLHYVHSDTAGLGRARNIALRLAETEIVVMTDDDCLVPADWLRQMQDAFAVDPKIAVVFCTVAPTPHDPQAGFIPQYQVPKKRLFTHLRQKVTQRGMGAGMAVRRGEVLAIGGFDEMLGPGAPFPSADDWDMATRALCHGFYVYETDATEVLHFGFRTYQQRRDLVRRDFLAIAGVYTKPLQAGHWSFWFVPLQFFLADAVWPMVRDLIHLKRPRGKTEIVTFIQGTWRGWRTPIDRQSLMFHLAPGKQLGPIVPDVGISYQPAHS